MNLHFSIQNVFKHMGSEFLSCVCHFGDYPKSVFVGQDLKTLVWRFWPIYRYLSDDVVIQREYHSLKLLPNLKWHNHQSFAIWCKCTKTIENLKFQEEIKIQQSLHGLEMMPTVFCSGYAKTSFMWFWDSWMERRTYSTSIYNLFMPVSMKVQYQMQPKFKKNIGHFHDIYANDFAISWW